MSNVNQIISELKKEKIRRNKEAENKDWNLLARPEQKIPPGNWFGWFIMAGRGFGKTRTGAETIKKFALSGEYKRICLLGETYDQVRNVMIEGESGLLNIHTKEECPLFRPSKREVKWKNGTTAICYSAENYEALRGPQFDLAWVDELAKFENAEKVWEQLSFCLRLGNQPKVIITSTPRAKNIITKLASRKDIHLTTGSTFDNENNLPNSFLNMLKNEYTDTTLAKQEIEGIILTNNTASLWDYADFQYNTFDFEKEHKIIIAIDPAMTAKETSDETGIIVAAKQNDQFFILEDKSARMNANTWMHIVADLFQKYNAEKIIIETNQGGEVLMSMLNSFKNLPWESVRAKENKYSRAIPISTLYKQKKVVHIQKFEELEKQLINAHMNYADDRMDALVWALFSLNKPSYISNSDFHCWS